MTSLGAYFMPGVAAPAHVTLPLQGLGGCGCAERQSLGAADCPAGTVKAPDGLCVSTAKGTWSAESGEPGNLLPILLGVGVLAGVVYLATRRS